MNDQYAYQRYLFTDKKYKVIALVAIALFLLLLNKLFAPIFLVLAKILGPLAIINGLL